MPLARAVSRPIANALAGPITIGREAGSVEELVYDHTIALAANDGRYDAIVVSWLDTATTIYCQGFIPVTVVHAGVSFPTVPIEQGTTISKAEFTVTKKTPNNADVSNLFVLPPGAGASDINWDATNAPIPGSALDSIAISLVGLGEVTWDVTSLANSLIGHASWSLNDFFNIAIQGVTAGEACRFGAVGTGPVANDPANLKIWV